MLAFICIFALSFAQEISTPEYIHGPILFDIIKKDVLFKKEAEYNISIIYNDNEDDSIDNMNRIKYCFKDLNNAFIKVGYKIIITEIPFQSKGAFYSAMDNNKIKLVYLCSDLDKKTIQKINDITQELNILTTTGSEELFEYGASISVSIKNTSSAELISNKNDIIKVRNLSFYNSIKD